MSSFGIYTAGYVILIIGLAIAAFLLGAPPVWIGVGALILIGIGIMSGVTKTRTPTEDKTPDQDKPQV